MGYDLQAVGTLVDDYNCDLGGVMVSYGVKLALQSVVSDCCRKARWNVWSRVDLGTRCFKKSMTTGPDWREVKGRIAIDLTDGKIIDAECGDTITRPRETRQIDRNNVMDIQTVLLYAGRCDSRDRSCP